MNKAWLYVIIGGLLDAIWALTLKKSDGFTQIPYTVITIVFVVISFYLFAKGLKYLPSGVAYTVFTGIGAVGSILLGIVLLGESIGMLKIVFSIMLIAGILGLKMNSKEEE